MVFEPTLFEFSDLRAWALAIILSGCRVLTFVLMSPFFNSRAMNRSIRAGLIMAIAVTLAPTIFPDFDETEFKATVFAALVVKELIIGLILGGLIWMPVRGLEFAGTLLDTQRGSTMGQDMNVLFNAPQTSYTAILLTQIFGGLFFASGGMIVIINVLVESNIVWSPTDGWPGIGADGFYVLSSFAGAILLSALLFTLPISGFMLLADIGIAFIAKGAPTLNALALGMPVKSGVMLIMLYFYLAIGFPVILESFMEGADTLVSLIADVR